MQKLLIIGCRRSGTTLLASMVGAHSQINMLDGAHDKCVDKLIGKRYQGVKMTIPHIHYKRRASDVWLFIYQKIAFLRKVFLKMGIQFDPYHGSKYSILDFARKGKIIFIYRDEKSNIDSMMKWAKLSRRRAQRTFKKTYKIKKKLLIKHPEIKLISFKQLTNCPKETLRDICKYLGLEYESRMLKAAGLNKRYGTMKIIKKS